MANFMFGKALEGYGNGAIIWTSDNIKIVLVDAADYTPASSTDQYLSDIPSGGRVGTSGNLASKTNTLGVMDAADVVISAVSGDTFEDLVFYSSTGTDSTSRLHCFYDTSVTGLPATPNGGDITIQLPNDAYKVYKL